MNTRLIPLLCLMLVGFLPFVFAEEEPNDTIATANWMELNGTVSGELGAAGSLIDTIDIYRFTLETDGFLQIGVAPSSELNVEIMLKDHDGMYQLAYKNDTGNGGTESIVYPNLLAGTYYVIVKIPDTLGTVYGSYNLSVHFLAVEEIDQEPNDSTSQVVPMPANGEKVGHIGYYGGQYQDLRDRYVITLPEDGKLELTVYPDGTCNLELGLYDSVLYKNLAFVNQKGKGESEKIVYSNLRAGTYHVYVGCTEGYGSYNLTSLFTADPYPNEEPDDSAAQAHSIILSQDEPAITVNGRLGYYGNLVQDDNDFYQITIPAYGSLTYSAKMDAGSGLSFGYETYDESLRYISSSTTINNLIAGTYYLRLNRGGGWGSYSLVLSFAEQTPPVPAGLDAVNLDPNGSTGAITISPETPVYWYQVSLPQDGQLSVSMKASASGYVYLRLFQGDGITRISEKYTYWNDNPVNITIPNLRAGNYKVMVARADGTSPCSVTTEYIPVTKIDAEPNDDYSLLNPVPYNQTYVGNLGYGGNGWTDMMDRYLFDIPEDGSISITATTTNTHYMYFTLYSFTGNQFVKYGETYNYWTTEPRSIGKSNIAAGRYMLQLWRSDGYGEYSIDVQFTPNRSNDAEINGDDWDPTLITQIDLNQGYVGHLGYENNMRMDTSDYFKVELPEDGALWFTFKTKSSGYFYFRLYYGDFRTKVHEQYTYWTEDTRSIGSDALRAGTYYVSVDRADGYGTYQLFANFRPQQFPDTDEHHLAAQAQPIALGELVQGSMGYTDLYYRDTVDWYQVEIAQEGKYRLWFHNSSSTYFAVELYQPNMVSRISSDYRYWNTEPFSRDVDLAPGTYFIKCVRNDGVGEYNLLLGSVDDVIAGTVTGKVTTKTGFPLAEINVRLLNKTVQTDALGVYTLPNVPPGTYPVTFDSGTKYYPETRKATVQPGESVKLDVLMLDSNKTAPYDVEKFYGVADNQHIHLMWSASVSPDVADGGGYKLYINDAQPLDLGNVLMYFALGFENDVPYTCRLTVYDKYGNESAGKTVIITPGGEGPIIVPTPTPTLPVQDTPTPTPTRQPDLTPTPTVTPQPATPTPGTTEPTATPTQRPIHGPIFVFEFDKATFAENGWTDASLSGFTPGTPAGFAKPGMMLLDGIHPASADQKGLMVTVRPVEGSANLDQVCFVFCTSQIQTFGLPVLIHAYVQAEPGSEASVFLGALKGSLSTGASVDGSIAYVNPQTTTNLMASKRIVCLYQPDGDVQTITPFIQVAAKEGAGTATVYIDRVEVYLLYADEFYPGSMFMMEY